MADAADATGTEGVLERGAQILDYLDGLLVAVDPALVTQPQLDAIPGNLLEATNLTSQLAGNPALAGNIDQQLESILTNAAPMAAVRNLPPDEAKRLGKTLAPAASSRLRELEASQQQLQGALDTLEERRTTMSSELEQLVNARREELSTGIDALRASIDAERERVNQLVSAQDQQFTSAQEARLNEFTQLREELKTQGDAAIGDVRKDGADLTAELETQAHSELAQIKDVHAKVVELYSVIGQKGTAGAFHDEAETQKTEADTWRKRTVTFGATAAAVALAAAVAAALGAGTSPAGITAKVTATVALAVLAAYAARQSGQHRHREEAARRLELELVAFEPFILSLDEGEQREARKAFLERFFTGQAGSRSPGSVDAAHTFGALTPEMFAAVWAAAQAAK